MALAILNRGLMACLLTSWALGISPLSYASKIYTGPLTAAGVALAVSFLLKPFVRGESWSALALGAAIVGLVYLPLAFFLAVSPEHRQMIALRLTAMRARILPHAA
ncbi:MAG: hypothetical protein H7Y20_10920 [Bryobacteraceae bacterium]|nr:hypothetical protein [Bryobacteraceae bacterium]